MVKITFSMAILMAFDLSWGQCYKTFFVSDLRIFALSQSVFQTRLEKLTNDKHSSLLRKSVIYGQKSFITEVSMLLNCFCFFTDSAQNKPDLDTARCSTLVDYGLTDIYQTRLKKIAMDTKLIEPRHKWHPLLML